MAVAAQRNLREIFEATRRMDGWLDRLTLKQQEFLLSGIKMLEKRTLTLLDDLEREKGRLISTQVNLRQAQALHAEIGVITDAIWGPRVKLVKKDLGRITARSRQYLSTLTQDAVKYTGVDRTYITQLNRLTLKAFRELGTDSVDKVARAMYEHLMGGGEFNSLKRTIGNVYTGRKSVTGRPMTTYARQMAFDETRNFSQSVVSRKARDIGLTSVLYYGDVIRASRPFCKRHAGKVLTEADLNRLDKTTWQGKSGPLRTHRGGHNCRHALIPVRDEWIEGRETEVQNYFEENL